MRPRNAIIIAGLLCLLWFGIFGGEVVLPITDEIWERNHWRDYLVACQPDELRTYQYLGGYERQAGALNLTTGILAGEPAPVITRYDLFWTRDRMIFHTINYPGWGKSYSPATLGKIKSFLATLPQPASTSLRSYRAQFHLAFFQDGKLRIHDYRKDDARKELAPLFDLLDFSLITD